MSTLIGSGKRISSNFACFQDHVALGSHAGKVVHHLAYIIVCATSEGKEDDRQVDVLMTEADVVGEIAQNATNPLIRQRIIST